MIKGKETDLIPASLDDKQRVYEWCFQSETTKAHSGPPDYPENPIATKAEFLDDVCGYADYYFTGSQPQKGRGFIITHNGTSIGFISYAAFHLQPYKAELDIWMPWEANCGKEFGTDAIVALGDYLNQALGIRELIMRLSVKNLRSNRSYEKAGLKETDMRPNEYLRAEYLAIFGDGDYGTDGTALLVKTFNV